MTIRIKLTIDVKSDFHIGTGSGRGRATDAVFLRDGRGICYIPGSTIKGLASDCAETIVTLHTPKFGDPPRRYDSSTTGGNDENFGNSYFRELFGGGRSIEFSEDRVFFDDAYPINYSDGSVIRSGRSARDRESGRSKDEHLFFYEDAPAAIFETELVSESGLSQTALLLLLLSLRSIVSIGGQRRRGKGKCECSVRVLESPFPELQNVELPCANDEQSKVFKKFADTVLNPDSESKTSALVARPIARSLTGISSDHQTQTEETVWIVFGHAESPISISRSRAIDNVSESFDFIPGATMRGAVAWNLLRNGVLENDPVFVEAIAREKIRFGSLYPTAVANWGRSASMPMPFPASIHTCKHYPGATPSRNHHGFADRLIVPLSETCGYRLADDEPNCNATLKPLGGFLQLSGNAKNHDIAIEHASVQLEIFQRTAINRQTQRAQEGELYGFEAIPRGTFFGGYIRGPKHLLESVMQPWKQGWSSLRVGKVRTRGLGHLMISCQPIQDEPNKDYPGLLSANEINPPTEYEFFLTLYSELIALDRWMRPVTQLTADELWRLIGGQDSVPFKIESGYASTLRIGGYVGKVGIPRTPDTAIRAGSTWKLKWHAAVSVESEKRKKAWELLKQAQKHGIGLRRADGFGQIILNHPIHQIGKSFGEPTAAINFDRVAIANSPTHRFKAQAQIEPRLKAEVGQTNKRNHKYERLFHEISQLPNPASELALLLNTLSSSRQNKSDSLKRFVDEHKAKVFGTTKDRKMDDLLKDLIEKEPEKTLSDPLAIEEFRSALVQIAKGHE